MYSNGYSSSRSSLRYYPVSSGPGYRGSRFDDDPYDQMEYLSFRLRRNEHGHRDSGRINAGRSADASRFRHGAAGRTTHSSGYGPGYSSSQDTMNRGRSRSRAPTRASTVYPDDSISNTGRRPHRHRDAEVRGRSVAPAGHRGQRVVEGYPPTLPSASSH